MEFFIRSFASRGPNEENSWILESESFFNGFDLLMRRVTFRLSLIFLTNMQYPPRSVSYGRSNERNMKSCYLFPVEL